MAKQLIYRNPLAVLWQMETHGVKFEFYIPDCNGFAIVDIIRIGHDWHPPRAMYSEIELHRNDDISHDIEYMYSGEHYFRVHPDSLPTFEPQEGDVVSIGGDRTYPGPWHRMYSTRFYHFNHRLLINFYKKKGQIETRNGKHFMWPCEIREDGDD